MVRVQLGCGLLRRGEALLLVLCRYESEPEPLWVLPGGRQEPGESIADTVTREFAEETSLAVGIEDLAYVSESIDPDSNLHVVNTTFFVRESQPLASPKPADPKVLECRFVPSSEAPRLLRADVLTVPVTAALSRDAHPHYFLFHSKAVKVPFFTRG